MKKILLWTIIIVLLEATAAVCVTAETEEESPQPPSFAAQVLFDLLNNATVEQRTRASRWLANKYPSLGEEVVLFINECAPGLLSNLRPHLEHLVKTKYQRLPSLIHAKLSQAPHVQNAVVELIREEYPELITDLQALPEGEDLQQRAAELIQQKYPTLLGDVLATVTQKFPTLLQDLQRQVIATFPGLLADVARFMARNHPDLSEKILGLVTTKHPQLLPGLLVILTEPPPVATPESGEAVGEPTSPAPTTP